MEADGTPKRRRCRFQFSLRTLLVVVTLCAIPCSWLGVQLRKAERQRQAVAAVKRLGGWVEYGRELNLFSSHIFSEVEVVHLERPVPDSDCFATAKIKATNDDLERLSSNMPRIQVLRIDSDELTDAGLEHIKGLTRLTVLGLRGIQITDAGLERLRGLKQLRCLFIERAEVTDNGIEHLTGLTQLQTLHIRDSKVTNDGVKKLQQALPNCRIYH